jgi:hypothetical protein
VAISHALVYSSGLTFDLIAQVEGIKPRELHGFFHAQHLDTTDPDEFSDELIRLGVEYPDGARGSKLGLRRRWATPGEGEPDSPILMQAGGSGGGTCGTRASWHLNYWL